MNRLSVPTIAFALAFGLGLSAALAQETPAAPAAPPAGAAPQAGEGGAAGFPIPQAGGDEASQIEMIAGLCGVQMKSMSPLACRCLAERSMTALSAPQRDYLIATAVSPPVADRMLADRRVGQADQGVIFAFLNETSDACASGTYREPPAAAPTPAPEAAPAPTPTPAPPAAN